MAPNCIFETVSGPYVYGNRFEGQTAVREAFASAWKNFPDAQWLNGKHFVANDRGVSEWLFIGTGLDGKRVEANGIDVFTFSNGKILVKNAFRKMRT
jgi:ketosteroid isomerase-like protein